MERGGTSSLGDDRGGSDPKGPSTGAADPPASRPLPTSAVDPATLDPSQENGLPSARSLRRGSAGITPDGRLRSGRLAGLSMGAAILMLAWPILAESFLGSLVGLTDTYLSAQISEAATDAIAGASYVMWFIGLVVMSVASGATALVSRAVGASRLAVANAALAQSLVLGLLAGAGVGGLVALLAPLGATALSLHGEAREAFLTYMWIIAGGVPGISILAIGIACARGAGDSVRPLVSMVIVNIVNMCASVLLSGVDLKVAGAPGSPARVIFHNPLSIDLGPAGIALGTVIGDYVGAAFMLWLLHRGTSGLVLLRRRFRPHWITIKRLVRIAVPSFLETFGMWIGNFLIILIVGWMGAGFMGAHIIAVRIESFSYLPGLAIGTAAATLAGQYLGAGAPELAKRAVTRCVAMTAVFMGLAGVMFLLLNRPIVGLISTQQSHQHLAPPLLFITGWVQIPFGVSIVLRSALRGAGDAKAVAYLLWLTTYGLRLPAAYLLSGVDIPVPGWLGGGVIPHPFFHEPSLNGLWIALCGEIVIRGALYWRRFRGGAWMSAKV